MKMPNVFKKTLLFSLLLGLGVMPACAATPEKEPQVPRFSIENMDLSVSPSVDFNQYANGTWIKKNPVPADRAIWASFSELDARNEYLLHSVLEDASNVKEVNAKSPVRLVGDFYYSAMDTDKLEKIRFMPLYSDFNTINQIRTSQDLFYVLANFHKMGVSSLFNTGVAPDEKNSTVYAFQIAQGGLSLPDRDYYLKDEFQKQREAFVMHVKNMFMMLGESQVHATLQAETVLRIETALAKASRSRVEMRDPIKNYNKMTTAELINKTPNIPWNLYLINRDIKQLPYAIVGQPEFFVAVEKLLNERPISDWKIYMKWHLLNDAAPFLHQAACDENFNFYGKILKGQEQQRDRWKRALAVIDGSIGEALGQLYVEKYFPAEAKSKMNDLVNNLRDVFHDHLQKLDWMSNETRVKALLKFERFSHKIGYPDKFRDYSTLDIKRDDYFGNVRRANAFEIKRQTVRIGNTVNKTEWEMTPPTVNAYFNPPLNEIVFPAGILQPPFFDTTMDDAVNYGAIAVVIGHEITHGYDDEGRHYDAEGNLVEWWSDKDAEEFRIRAQKIVDEYNTFEILPGVHVNGELTLGENIADLGGISIAYDAMERALAKDPTKRKIIDGLTPEQRFFISYAQVWRTTIKDEEARRRITIDPHAPGKFRSFGPLLNYQEFYDAFGIKPGSTMWRAPELRAKIW